MAKDTKQESKAPEEDPRRVASATVENVRYRDGYAPGDTAKATMYQRFENDRVVTEAGEGFRGTVLVQEGDVVTPAVARLLAEQ